MKRAILLGDSPFIKEVENKIQYVLDRYYSMGINRIVYRFKTSSHVFVDAFMVPLANERPDLFTVSLAKYKSLIKKPNKDLYDSYSFDFRKNTERDLKKDNKLAWSSFTHDYALSYLITEGYDDIILIGAADFTLGAHYSNPYNLVCSDKFKEKSKRFIEDICCKRATIRTCNPNSYLGIPTINIDELLI